jgi:hypothetical protein
MTKATWNSLYFKYSHIGCPGAHMEDNCPHPGKCADEGCCEIVRQEREDLILSRREK